jgi:phospholipid/cholesterol/gamma-HCH transport system ATP-binding protein
MKQEFRITSVVITHDMTSAYKVADRIAMLYNGKIVTVGTPEELRKSDNQIVQQFIHGRAEGPIKEW